VSGIVTGGTAINWGGTSQSQNPNNSPTTGNHGIQQTQPQGQQGNGGQDSDFQNCRGGVCQHITQPIQVLNQGTQQTQPQNQGMKHQTINNCKDSTNNGCVSVSGIVTGGTAINWDGTSQSQNPNNSPTATTSSNNKGTPTVQTRPDQTQKGHQETGQSSDFQNCRGNICEKITHPIKVLNQNTHNVSSRPTRPITAPTQTDEIGTNQNCSGTYCQKITHPVKVLNQSQQPTQNHRNQAITINNGRVNYRR